MVDLRARMQVWDANVVARDAFLGRATVPAPIDNECRLLTVQLSDKSESTASTKPYYGRIKLKLSTYDDVLYL